ncbi:MAG: lipid IV(A) 3-deoxy-D-manno-octulosonic acid transferase [Pseudohongiellaceae bacterium]
MHRIIYSVIFYLALPVILLRLLFRSLKAPAYRRRILERFALQALPQEKFRDGLTVWIHAVSVGETVAAAPLVTEMRNLYPDARIVVTTMTPTGSDRVRSLFGEAVYHCYIPYDLPGACNRFLDKFQPRLLILMETELWPNLIHVCHRRGVRLMLANARLSEKSAAGYRRFSRLTRELLEKVDSIAAQASPDAERFIALGAKRSIVKITGSLKFIVEKPGKEKPAYFTAIQNKQRPILVAASTRDGEEEKVLRAFAECLKLTPSLLLLLIPRHPERFNKVYKLSTDKGFTTAKRSDGEEVAAATQVVVGDSMGEMIDYYSVATIAFVGGSLVDTGCQNVLEPAAMGVPILVGPSQFNFATICRQLELAGALITVEDEKELAQAILALLADEDVRTKMAASGLRLISENQDALSELMKLIDSFIRTDFIRTDFIRTDG